MAENHVPFREVNIEEDEEAAVRVEQWNKGNRTVPTFDIDGSMYTNPSVSQLRQILGL